MARRPGERRVPLSPGARRIAGWVAAVAIVAGIAIGAQIVGGSGEGEPNASAGGSPSADEPTAITFGTALDPTTGLVATASRTSDFAAGDTFAYSVADVAPPPNVYVEVERLAGGPGTIVQAPALQTLGPGAVALAFSVPAAAVLDTFGPGQYEMRIYVEGETAPVAEGTFTLVEEPTPTASG